MEGNIGELGQYIGVGLTAVTTFGRLLLVEDPLSVRAHIAEEEL